MPTLPNAAANGQRPASPPALEDLELALATQRGRVAGTYHNLRNAALAATNPIAARRDVVEALREGVLTVRSLSGLLAETLFLDMMRLTDPKHEILAGGNP